METKVGTWGWIIIISGFLVLASFAFHIGPFATPASTVGGVCTTAPSGYQCGVNLGASFNLQDPLLGGGINSATITMYNGQTQVDSATTASTGIGASGASAYSTGQAFTCKISATNYVTMYVPCTIPPIPASTSPATTVSVPLYDITKGAWSMTAVGTGGTTFSTNQVYWWAADTLTSMTLQITFTETTVNNGWKSTYDPINQVMDDLVVQVDDGGGASSNSQYLTVTGEEYTAKIGTTNYFLMPLPDGIGNQVACSPGSASCTTLPWGTDALGRYTQPLVSSTTTTGTLASVTGASTLQQIGTTNTGGTVTFTWTIGKGNLAAGQQIVMTFKLYQNYDPNFFVNGNRGIGNPASGQPTSVNIGTASTFVIKFNG